MNDLHHDDPPAPDEGGLRPPPGLDFWGRAWWWFHFLILVKLARLRFVAILLVIGIVIIAVMIYACWELVLQELDVESPMLGVSKAWFAAAMPVGLVLMLSHIVHAWMDQGAAPVFRGETESIVETAGDAK